MGIDTTEAEGNTIPPGLGTTFPGSHSPLPGAAHRAARVPALPTRRHRGHERGGVQRDGLPLPRASARGLRGDPPPQDSFFCFYVPTWTGRRLELPFKSAGNYTESSVAIPPVFGCPSLAVSVTFLLIHNFYAAAANETVASASFLALCSLFFFS